VSDTHRHRLEAIVRQHREPQTLVKRARIVRMAGVGVRETARALSIGRATAQRWRKRWQRSQGYPFG
jgi:transposase-like protein